MRFNEVVRLEIREHIAYVYFEEKDARNTFTPRLICGIKSAFEYINESDAKVAIVQGYDTFFCCGGTKESLVALYTGIKSGEPTSFTDGHFFDTFLQCRIPIIAAMQGHALGGGFAFSLFADVLVMGEQSIFSGNYMRYGFTPGMGATLIVPYKMGKMLGWEMLYTAKNYFGFELKERGVDAIVVKRSEVVKRAEEIARNIAEKPLKSIIQLKNNTVEQLRNALPDVVKKEVKMHKITFQQEEVYQNIKKMYLDEMK